MAKIYINDDLQYDDGNAGAIVLKSGDDLKTEYGFDYLSVYESYKTLENDGIQVTYDKGVFTFVGTAGENVKSDINSDLNELPITTNEPDSTSILKLMETSSKDKNTQLERQNAILDNQSKLIAESNRLSALSIKATSELTKIVGASTASIAQSVSQIAEYKKQQLNADVGAVISSIGNSKSIDNQNISTTVNMDTSSIDNVLNEIKTFNSNLSKTLTEIKDKDFTSTVNNTIDTSPIAEHTSKIATATETLADGVTDQIKTNEKLVEKANIQIEDLTYNKTPNTLFTDLEGKSLSPRDSAALKNSEVAKEVKDMNDTPLTELLSFITDLLGWGIDESSNALGVDDGLNSSFNILNFVFEELENDLAQELEKEKGLENE